MLCRNACVLFSSSFQRDFISKFFIGIGCKNVWQIKNRKKKCLHRFSFSPVVCFCWTPSYFCNEAQIKWDKFCVKFSALTHNMNKSHVLASQCSIFKACQRFDWGLIHSAFFSLHSFCLLLAGGHAVENHVIRTK